MKPNENTTGTDRRHYCPSGPAVFEPDDRSVFAAQRKGNRCENKLNMPSAEAPMCGLCWHCLGDCPEKAAAHLAKHGYEIPEEEQEGYCAEA